MTPTETRLAAIRAAIAEQVNALLAQHLAAAEQAAADADTDGDKPPVCKLRLAVQFPAGAKSPKLTVTIAYGAPVKDGTETTVDTDTPPLPGIDMDATGRINRTN